MGQASGVAVTEQPFTDARTRNVLNNVAFLGTYQPRECGIATFTSDLLHAIAAETPSARLVAVAMNDAPDGYDYPPEVGFQVTERRLADYFKAAEYLNANDFDAVCVQHEFGIFGGPDGEYLLDLLGELRMPRIVTLHTILREPSETQRSIISRLAENAERLVTMTQIGRKFLEEIYGVPRSRIAVIPHGIPDTPLLDGAFYKDKLGLAGRKVILTFGLLSPNKGIEVMIRALPEIVARHPHAVFVVLGATHPHVRRVAGEAYRLSLQGLARRLGVDGHVVFRDQFVTLPELCEYLGAADVYCTPYRNEAQVTSGTLVYAMATGNAVVSTPYWHAAEALADDRGRLVPFDDPGTLARTISGLLSDEAQRNLLRRRAYEYTRSHTWKEVARAYLELMTECCRRRQAERRRVFQAPTLRTGPVVLPEIRLDYLARLTDDVGVMQHSAYGIPDRAHGYCTDDNARALLVAVLSQRHLPQPDVADRLARTCLSFLLHAFDRDTGRFRNFMGYDRRWLERVGSEDSHGRAVWTLGETYAATTDRDIRRLTGQLFTQALPAARRLRPPRSVGYAILGVRAFLQQHPDDEEVRAVLVQLAERLFEQYRRNASADWPWFEQQLTYANALLPHALLAAGGMLERAEMKTAALQALQWLAELQVEGGRFLPIGNRGWYRRDGERARFDQQPIEAARMIPACLEAYRQTNQRQWLTEAERCFRWFLGDNCLGVPVYDEATGACYDGLRPGGLNENRGAESTLAWLSALAIMYGLRAEGALS